MFKALRGMDDLLPGPGAQRMREIEVIAREVFARFSYREIRTPVLEEKALFVRSIGTDTDIVVKEMFAFQDRGERDVALRPEGTAPVVRAYLEANYHNVQPFQKLYYVAPMFRAERPQRGRLRQFYQIGAEAIGSPDPSVDAEIIHLLVSILDAASVKGYSVRLNNLGCSDDKLRLSESLARYWGENSALLCEDCKRRAIANPLRVLDCKRESCRTVARGAITGQSHLCDACQGHFKAVLGYLDGIGLSYLVDPHIVRGLDYYTKTVFEVSHPMLGAQDAIGAGGRYDRLVSDLGGPELGAAGFALGLERLALALGDEPAGAMRQFDVYIAPLGHEARLKAFEVASKLRTVHAAHHYGELACEVEHEERSLKAMLRTASGGGARLALIIGEDELRSGNALLRDMVTREQKSIPMTRLVEEVSAALALPEGKSQP